MKQKSPKEQNYLAEKVEVFLKELEKYQLAPICKVKDLPVLLSSQSGKMQKIFPFRATLHRPETEAETDCDRFWDTFQTIRFAGTCNCCLISMNLSRIVVGNVTFVLNGIKLNSASWSSKRLVPP